MKKYITSVYNKTLPYVACVFNSTIKFIKIMNFVNFTWIQIACKFITYKQEIITINNNTLYYTIRFYFKLTFHFYTWMNEVKEFQDNQIINHQNEQ